MDHCLAARIKFFKESWVLKYIMMRPRGPKRGRCSFVSSSNSLILPILVKGAWAEGPWLSWSSTCLCFSVATTWSLMDTNLHNEFKEWCCGLLIIQNLLDKGVTLEQLSFYGILLAAWAWDSQKPGQNLLSPGNSDECLGLNLSPCISEGKDSRVNTAQLYWSCEKKQLLLPGSAPSN